MADSFEPADRPKVSVLMLAFNHAKYVARSVESALSQETDFDFEIVIGEDFSHDGTREILVDLRDQHPSRINLLLPPANLGFMGMRNYAQTLAACRGDYVAFLECDDYWIEPKKLQRQADLLDQRPDIAVCSGKVNVVNRDDEFVDVWPREIPELFTLEDLLIDGNLLPTPVTMFRNGLFGSLPEWCMKLSMGDWPTHVMNAMHGDVFFMQEPLAAYRKHEEGAWSGLEEVERIDRSVRALLEMRKMVGPKYRVASNMGLARRYRDIAKCYRILGRRGRAFAAGLKRIRYESVFGNDWRAALIMAIGDAVRFVVPGSVQSGRE